MRELTGSEREAMQMPLREYWVEKDGLLPKETRAFDAGFTAGLDHSAAEIAAYILSLEGLQAERDGLRAALKRIAGFKPNAAIGRRMVEIARQALEETNG